MKIASILFVFVITTSCAHRNTTKEPIEARVLKQEARSLEEIRTDTNDILEAHPEFDQPTKDKLRSHINAAVLELKNLRGKESKVIHTLLEKFLAAGAPVDTDSAKVLKNELRKIYASKSETISNLIEEIRNTTRKTPPNSTFPHELEYLMREFR